MYNKKYADLSDFERKLIPLEVLFNKKLIYKKYIKGDYDVEIAFLEGPITRLFSVKNKKTRKIAWIHNDISQVFGKGIKAKIKKSLDKKTYSKYETLVFVSKDNFKKFNETYKNIRNEYLEPVKKEIIYNYIDAETVRKKAKETADFQFDKQSINFLQVSRLVEQKAIDRTIRVHKKLIDSGLEHHFYVIGDGPESEKLEKMVNENGIKQTFHLLRKKENPYPYIKEADYFCLLSEFEGYGMVLEEAKILGKSIIITDTAAREAVKNYENANVLENTEDGIYNGLKNIILYNKKSQNKQGKEDIIQNEYDNIDIIKKIEKLIINKS